jgi:DNA adenine methylase
VLLQKPRSPLETYNDLDGNVVNFFRVLRDQPDELIRKIRLTPWARAEYELAWWDCEEPIERARRFFTFAWQSMNGTTNLKSGGTWACQKWSNRRYVLPTKALRSVMQELESVARRFEHVQIECSDAIICISRFDNEDALIYCDPPYVVTERSHKNEYTFEADANLHQNLAVLLDDCEGYAVVSGYACPLYTELYEAHGWARYDKEAQTNSGGKRIESLWLSPRTVEALNRPEQAGLFDHPPQHLEHRVPV